jgi:hypothetical protein
VLEHRAQVLGVEQQQPLSSAILNTSVNTPCWVSFRLNSR